MKTFITLLLLFLIGALQQLNAQNIGIGTTTPQNKLEINSAIANRSGLRLTQLAGKADSAGYSAQLVNGNFSSAFGTATDAAGTIYVSDAAASIIYKVAASGSITPFVTTGLNQPFGMAFDSNGNLYVCNYGNNSVLKINTAGAVSPFASGFNGPTYIAYNANNLYVSNTSGSTISKIALTGAVTALTTTAVLNEPTGLAFDASGFLYVSNSNLGTITKINIANGASNTFVTLKSGTSPFALKFDPTGDLLIGALDSLYSVTPAANVTGLIRGGSFAYGLYIDNTNTIYGINKELFKLAPYFNSFLSVNNNGDLVLAPNPINVNGGNALITGNVTTNGNTITIGNTITNGNDSINGSTITNGNTITTGSTTTNGNDTIKGNAIINGNISANSISAGGGYFTNFFQVGNVGAFNRITNIKMGGLASGTSTTQKTQVTLTFAQSFADAFYTIVFTPEAATGIFAVSIVSKSTTACTIEIYRIDGTNWNQGFNISWIAIDGFGD